MRKLLSSLFAFSLVLGTAMAQGSRDSVVVDPDVHHVVFQNEHARIFEARASAGRTSPMHTHPPCVVVGVAPGRVKYTLADGTAAIRDIRAGEVLWLDGAEHSWKIFAGAPHVVVVEPLSAQGPRQETKASASKATPDRPDDAVVVDPDVHHVVFENDHVRVFEARAAPGYKSPMHSHPPFALISIGSARLKMTPAGAEGPVIVDLRPGQVLWLDGARHSWELLAGNLHAVGVEVKSARAAKQQ